MPAATARTRWWWSAATRLGDVLCPPACVACDAVIDPAVVALCEACRSDLTLFDAACRRCGSPVAAAGGEAPDCGRCRPLRLRFDEAIAAGAYDGVLRSLVLRAKRLRCESAGVALGGLIWERAERRLRAAGVDVVASVPMHWSRRLHRQTNSPESIATLLAERLGAPVARGLLRRVRPTPQQSRLPKSSRAENVRRAFRLGGGYRLAGATVALVDDVLTTGATCSEAAAELKRRGAGRVVAVVAARAL